MEHTADFDELAGRINGIGQALLRLTAELEMQSLIDGPRLCASLRRAAAVYSSDQIVHGSTQAVLLELAKLLDESRTSRPARLARGQSRARRPRAAPASGPGPR